MQLGLYQKTKQSLHLSPQLIQSIKFLQYSSLELLNHIQKELSENPFLEEENNDFNSDNSRQILLENKLKRNLLDTNQSNTGEIIEKTFAQEFDLLDDLIKQLSFLYQKNSIHYKVGEYILSSLSDEGFFLYELLEEIRSAYSVEIVEILEVLNEIKSNFEPVGIAAGDLRESLLIQLRRIVRDQSEDYSVLIENQIGWKHDIFLEEIIIRDHFDLFRKQDKKNLIKRLKIDESSLDEAMNNIFLLEPMPGRKFNNINNAIINPDVFIFVAQGEKIFFDLNQIFPKLRMVSVYNKKNWNINSWNEELKEFIKEKENKARTLIDTLAYRKSNLEIVIKAIIRTQKDFFLKGYKAMKPYTITKLAEETGINQSTLSRIINSKYADTPWGIVNLKLFFPGSTDYGNRNDLFENAVSSSTIKHKIKEIVDEYDGEKKLSDQNIVEVLKKEGIIIARRTVAKYRKQFDILSSFQR